MLPGAAPRMTFLGAVSLLWVLSGPAELARRVCWPRPLFIPKPSRPAARCACVAHITSRMTDPDVNVFKKHPQTPQWVLCAFDSLREVPLGSSRHSVRTPIFYARLKYTSLHPGACYIKNRFNLFTGSACGSNLSRLIEGRRSGHLLAAGRPVTGGDMPASSAQMCTLPVEPCRPYSSLSCSYGKILHLLGGMIRPLAVLDGTASIRRR